MAFDDAEGQSSPEQEVPQWEFPDSESVSELVDADADTEPISKDESHYFFDVIFQVRPASRPSASDRLT